MKALLFDLDGTLVDTAPDLCGTIQDMQADRGLAITEFADMQHLASGGARLLLKAGFGIEKESPEFPRMRTEFLERYQARIARESVLYDGLEDVLAHIERKNLLWAVVTNKPYYLAEQLLTELNLLSRCALLVGGDTASEPKPSPAPCLLSCEKLKVAPRDCIMIGDDERDVVSGRKAGMLTAAVRYGYIASDLDQWGADLVFDRPSDLKAWVEKF
ncbi:MAG: HAD-IA family hydrolase [Limnobacter sp.]|nr:HAD-IA family hydrolase [Limnobacter sp.]